MTQKLKRTIIVAIAVVGLAGAVTATDAEVEEAEGWQFSCTTLLWMSGLEGDVTVSGTTADIDLGFDDIFEHLDIGVQVYLELRQEKFGFFSQPNYMVLSADGTTRAGGKVEVEQTWWIVELGGFYQVAKIGSERPLTLDVLGGVRYWSVKTELDITGTVTFNGEDTTELLDPLIGIRAMKYLTDKLFLSLRADVGGFDLSEDTSRFSWQVAPVLGYDFNRYFTAFAGYRVLAIEFENGNGASQSGANLQMQGVLLGFNFDFFGWLSRNK